VAKAIIQQKTRVIDAGWWKTAGIDPAITARALWLETRPLPTIPGTPDRD
jgi:hypothetical protein